MITIVINKSRKRKLKQTKRVLSSLLFRINHRTHIGDIPSRVLIKLIKDLRKYSGRGINIKVFIESKEGYNGFKLIEIGKNEDNFEMLTNSSSKIDDKLKKEGIIKTKPKFEEYF